VFTFGKDAGSLGEDWRCDFGIREWEVNGKCDFGIRKWEVTLLFGWH
jgi:hypothetical protein